MKTRHIRIWLASFLTVVLLLRGTTNVGWGPILIGGVLTLLIVIYRSKNP